MSFYPNNITDTRTQPRDKWSFRIVLRPDDVIEGLVKPGDVKPEGIMVKGPFDNNPMVVKMREQAGSACSVQVQATYDLDYVEEEIDATASVAPRNQFTSASPTWETIFTQSLAALGKAARVIDWPSAGLSEKHAPTAMRFLFSSGSGEVRFEVEEGIL